MDENEIRKIVQDEYKNILSKSGLSEDNIIVKDDDITKKDIRAWESQDKLYLELIYFL